MTFSKSSLRFAAIAADGSGTAMQGRRLSVPAGEPRRRERMRVSLRIPEGMKDVRKNLAVFQNNVQKNKKCSL